MTAQALSSFSSTPNLEECVAVLAPYGQDALLLTQVLREAGTELLGMPDMPSFCKVVAGCAAGLLTTDALNPQAVGQLQAILRGQPPWSDVPLVLLANRIDPASYALLASALGNVTIVQRPLDPASLLTLIKAALRARQRQYEVRDLLRERQRAEEELRTHQEEIEELNERLRRSMTETHHRVKNSLQLISAFVDMQINEHDSTVPAAELRRINALVRTLAAVHDVLTHETKHGSADFLSAKILLDQLFPMLSSIAGGKRLRYEVDDIRLSSRHGTSLALVANELVINALKHSTNEVFVTLKMNDHSASLTVCDDGEGLPEDFSVEKSSSTGLALVENLARWDLRGETAYGNREDRRGARIVVTFPMALAAKADG